MPKKSLQKEIDDKAAAIFRGKLDQKFTELLPIDGNYPGIDGMIQIVACDREYTGKCLCYQVKGKTKGENLKISCEVDHLNHWAQFNPPVVFILVDIDEERVYWQYVDEDFVSSLKIKEKQKNKTIELRRFNEVVKDQPHFYIKEWFEIACKKELTEFSDIMEILESTQEKVRSLIGLLYLSGPINCKDKYVLSKIKKVLGFTERQSIILLYEGVKGEKIRNVGDLFWIDNKQEGVVCLHSAIQSKKIDIWTVYRTYDQEKDRREILKHLVQIEIEEVRDFFKTIAGFFNFAIDKNEFESNDDILVNLSLLEEYAFIVKSQAFEITRKIIELKIPKEKKEYKDKFWGSIHGVAHEDLLLKVLDILEKLRYVDPKPVLDQILHLSLDNRENIKTKAVNVLIKFAEYNFNVLKQVGYAPQVYLLEKMENWDKAKHFNVLLEISNKLLEPSFYGNSMKDFRTFVWHSGALPVDENIKSIRKKTITLLIDLFKNAEDLQSKRQVLQTLSGAFQSPHTGNYGDETIELIRESIIQISSFYAAILPNAELEVIKDIDEKINWLTKSETKNIPEIKRIKSQIATNSEYEIFRVFVGYDYKFSENKDWKESEKERKQKIQEFLDSMDENSYSVWESKIKKVLSNYEQSPDRSEYYYLRHFLFELGKQKPVFAINLIKSRNEELSDFLLNLISGVWLSNKKGEAKKIIKTWIKKSVNLSTCAAVFDCVDEIDLNMASAIFAKASQNKMEETLLFLIASIVRAMQKNKAEKKLINLFVTTINALTELNNWRWIDRVWYRDQLISDRFNESQIDVILENLLLVPDVNHQVESIISPIAERMPQKIIHFFHSRVKISITKDRHDRYDAIPYDLHKLNIVLARHCKEVIEQILRWYSEKDWHFPWEAGQLLKAIFPKFETPFVDSLVSMVKNGNKETAKIVMDIFEAYMDGSAPLSVCKAIVKKYGKDDKVTRRLSTILSNTGLVGGEYGMSKALEAKKVKINVWLKDRDKKVRDFASYYIRSLNLQIAYENKKTDEDLALRESSFKHDKEIS